MRQEFGLADLIQSTRQRLTASTLSTLLLDDLRDCRCVIFGKNADKIPILLAELHLTPESLSYECFDKRLDFRVTGIIQEDGAPLTYKVQGQRYGFHGRCSTIPHVCGVDLYLNDSYTEKKGDTAQQRFSISTKRLLTRLPKIR
ncbi:MAG: hypothetical protein KAG10_09570 [Methylococcales bacterium]|nr:hypothetical protein [Methylococcales bacterium]MCK5926129.1 hypothetical protein [Methylococcales bacterium]